MIIIKYFSIRDNNENKLKKIIHKIKLQYTEVCLTFQSSKIILNLKSDI